MENNYKQLIAYGLQAKRHVSRTIEGITILKVLPNTRREHVRYHRLIESSVVMSNELNVGRELVSAHNLEHYKGKLVKHSNIKIQETVLLLDLLLGDRDVNEILRPYKI